MGIIREIINFNNTFISTRRAFILASFSSLAGSFFISACKDDTSKVTGDEVLSFSLGKPEDFSPGLKVLNQLRVGLYKSVQGNIASFRAIRLVCTHQACALRGPAENTHLLPDSGVTLFTCPCHGARFDLNGMVLQGPATKPLIWLKLSLSKNGEILIHPEEEVDRDWQLLV